MSKVLPILFSTDMVLAILDGRKTVTRRVIKPQPKSKLCYTFAGSHKKDIGRWAYPSKTAHESWGEEYRLPDNITKEDLVKRWNPPYHTDDILYIRETWQYLYELDGNEQIVEDTGEYYYAATDTLPFDTYVDSAGVTHEGVPWRPSIHMPKEAARIWLKVKDVRVERLQDITDDDCEKEGLENFCKKCHVLFSDCDTCLNDEGIKGDFKELWNSTIKKTDLDLYGWDANPWVYVIEFERCEKPVDC